MRTIIESLAAVVAALALFGVALFIAKRVVGMPSPEEDARRFEDLSDEEKANEIAKNQF